MAKSWFSSAAQPGVIVVIVLVLVSIGWTPLGAFASRAVANAWTGPGVANEYAKFTASDVPEGDQLGVSLAMSGDTALVGAVNPADTTGNHAYVFTRSGSTWSQQATLVPSDTVEPVDFGIRVAIDGDTALVGAAANPEHAYVFTRSGNTWYQQAILPAFGSQVAVDGDTALVNGPSVGDMYATHKTVSVFARSGDTWSQEATLNGPAGDYYSGHSVALSGDTALVGTWPGESSPGHVCVFTRSLGIWSQQATLTASDGAAGDYFGLPVAVSGDTALVGAQGKDSGRGAAYVFTRSGGTWSQQTILTAPLPAANLGTSVALSGDTALVGARQNVGSWNGSFVGSWGGAAYIFTRSGDTWSRQVTLIPSDGPWPSGGFGAAVGLSGDTALVADYGGGPANGSAYAFNAADVGTKGRTTLTLAASKPSSAYGASAAFTARLSGVPVEQNVTLYRSTNGVTFSSDGTMEPVGVVGGGGWTYVATRPVTGKAYYQARFGGTDDLFASNSPTATLTSKAYLSAPSTPSTVRRNVYFTAYGYLKPRHSGYTRLYFYRRVYYRGRYVWKYFTYRNATNRNYSSYTKYVLTYRLPYAGRWYVKAYHACPSHISTWTGVRYFSVQ